MPKETREEQNGRGLLQIAQDLHMIAVGSMGIEDHRSWYDDYRLLLRADECWNDNNECSFDITVRLLIRIVINEVREFINLNKV